MTLLLTTDDAAQVISMETSLGSLELAFADLEEGRAADRPRARVYAHLENDLYYRYSSMDASLLRYGVHSVRLTSEHLVDMRIEGRLSREKPAAAPGGKFVGLIVLFPHQTLAPIAILQDSVVHRYMVGGTSALAAKYLAREDARRVGLIGAGLLAGTQLLGLKHVRPIEHVKVHGRRQDRLRPSARSGLRRWEFRWRRSTRHARRSRGSTSWPARPTPTSRYSGASGWSRDSTSDRCRG